MKIIPLIAIFVGIISSQEIGDDCLQCICKANSNCEARVGCTLDKRTQVCGPYHLSEKYWKECGKPGADWQSCTKKKSCSETCIINYLKKHGKKCVGDRKPTCADFVKVHYEGPFSCKNLTNLMNSYTSKVNSCIKEIKQIIEGSKKKLVCYFTNWSQYHPGEGKFVPENINPHLCTHIIYAFASINIDKLEPIERNDEGLA